MISNKVDEAYSFLKAELKTLFSLISESIHEALQSFSSFVTSCCEKLMEVLSWIKTQMELFKKVVGDRFTEKGSLQYELRMLVQNVRRLCTCVLSVAVLR